MRHNLTNAVVTRSQISFSKRVETVLPLTVSVQTSMLFQGLEI
jgi:hypothetical protein